MGTPTRWVKNPEKKNDYKKQYFQKGKWIDKKKNSITWKRIPYFVTSVDSHDFNRDYVPIFTSVSVALHQLYSVIGDYSGPNRDDILKARVKTYNNSVKRLLKDDALAAAWKEMTLAIVRYAIEAIPSPPEIGNFKEILMKFFMVFAESFYDFMFSI